jgi:hypothetical protein
MELFDDQEQLFDFKLLVLNLAIFVLDLTQRDVQI